MLQQTRVDTVIPYFERWMKRFPTVESLANADQERVLKCWEGLGYYARARNLHAGARQVVEFHQGIIPSDPQTLTALKGIGPYTLAAIMSLAFNQSYAVLDGNVERVLTRLCLIPDDIRKPQVKKELQWLATKLLADHPPGNFNEAMMELGATVCTSGKPRCSECPLAAICRGRKKGDPENYPFKSKKKPIPTVPVGAGIVWKNAKVFLIARRNQQEMLGGLWEFPGGKVEAGETMADCIYRELLEELGIKVEVKNEFLRVKHTYSHFHLRMTLHHCHWRGDTPQCLDCADFRWVTLAECRELPFSRADIKVLDALQEDTDQQGSASTYTDEPS